MDPLPPGDHWLGIIWALSANHSWPYRHRHARQCGVGDLHRQLYILYWDQLCRCGHLRIPALVKSGMAQTDYQDCRIDHCDCHPYWTVIHFALCRKVGQAASLGFICEITISDYLGRTGDQYIPGRRFDFPLSRDDQRFCDLPGFHYIETIQMEKKTLCDPGLKL